MKPSSGEASGFAPKPPLLDTLRKGVEIELNSHPNATYEWRDKIPLQHVCSSPRAVDFDVFRRPRHRRDTNGKPVGSVLRFERARSAACCVPGPFYYGTRFPLASRDGSPFPSLRKGYLQYIRAVLFSPRCLHKSSCQCYSLHKLPPVVGTHTRLSLPSHQAGLYFHEPHELCLALLTHTADD